MGFDSLVWSKRLQSVGVTQTIADEQAMLMTEFSQNHAVTREYLDARLDKLQSDLTLRIGSMVGVAVAAIVAFMKVV